MKYLNTIGTSKATDTDGIGDIVLKLATPSVAQHLTCIIYQSLDDRVYPSQWKWPKMIPVLKSRWRNETINYRPISILSVVSKITEHYVYDCLCKYLCKYKLLSPHQSGFRKYHSCNTCLCKITNDWLSDINDGNLVGFLAVDLSKAFDLINFDIFLGKIEIVWMFRFNAEIVLLLSGWKNTISLYK